MSHTKSLVYTTITSLNVAETLAAKAIEAKVATCINIIPGCMSIYAKDGKIMKGTECYLIFKTTSEKNLELQDWLKSNHPYETPAILAWDAATSPEFTTYIETAIRDFSVN